MLLMTVVALVFGMSEFLPEYTGALVQFVLVCAGPGVAGLGVLYGSDDERAFSIGVLVTIGVLASGLSDDFWSLCWDLLLKSLRSFHQHFGGKYLMLIYDILAPLLVVFVAMVNGIFCIWARKHLFSVRDRSQNGTCVETAATHPLEKNQG